MNIRVKNFICKHKFGVASASTAVVSVASSCPVLAAEGSGFIQTSWIADLLPNITADVNTLMPIGIGIMALFIGISLVPKVIYKFLG